ncbi:MAG: efflux RND transporter periplasmic adaptor subunit [Acidobacteriota bacterium]
MTPIRRLTGQLIFCGVATWAMCGCSKPEQAEAQSDNAAAPASKPQEEDENIVHLGPNAPELKQMTVEVVRAIPVPADEVTAPAKIAANPNRVGHAVLPAPGRIVRVLVKLGDSVTRGQPVVTLESPTITDAEFGYTQAETTVRQSELAVAKAEADLSRLSDLLEHQAVAQKEVLAARTTLALSQSAREQANSAREQARRRLELMGLKAGQFQQQITLTAPISGKVLAVNAVDGEFRNEITAPLVTIADLSRVWATSDVPESKIRYCKVGGMASLELIAFPNETFRAKVTRIADTVDGETRTIQVSAELDNTSGRFRPEMFGTVRYADGMTTEPWVPDAAVVRVNDQDFVFIELAPGRFRSTLVDVGKHHDGGFAIAKGLKTGDRVVTKGAVYLKAAL